VVKFNRDSEPLSEQACAAAANIPVTGNYFHLSAAVKSDVKGQNWQFEP